MVYCDGHVSWLSAKLQMAQAEGSWDPADVDGAYGMTGSTKWGQDPSITFPAGEAPYIDWQ